MREWILSAALHGGFLLGATLLLLQGHARPTESRDQAYRVVPRVEPQVTRRHVFEQEGDPRLRGAPAGRHADDRPQGSPWPHPPDRRFLRFQEKADDNGHGSLTSNSWMRPQITDRSITAALRWLARHQDPDGHWSAAGFAMRCAKVPCTGAGQSDLDEALTALSLLAFLRAGYTPYSREEYVDAVDKERELCFGWTVKAGLKWLAARQEIDGAIGRHGAKPMVNHAWATLALAEAYGLAAVEALQVASQKALDHLLAAQNPDAGWHYDSQTGESDTAVTGLAVLALHAADEAGFQIPRPAWEGALAWVRKMTRYGPPPTVGYNRIESGQAILPGVNETFADHPTLPALGSLVQYHIRGARERSLLPLITADRPVWAPEKVDFYYWYLGASALSTIRRPRDPDGEEWLATVNQVLGTHQKTSTDGCVNGSWDPGVDRWGSEGGRLYAVAVNCLTLEIPFEQRRRRLERSQYR